MITTTLQIETPRWAVGLASVRARYRGAWGGRGGGKSHFFAELLIERCIQRKTSAVCVREVQKSITQSVKRLLESKIESLGVSRLFTIQDNKIKTPYGGFIVFIGMQDYNAESIKGFEGFDICWIEEARALSQNSLDLLRPTFRNDATEDKPASEIWASWNPKYETDPIDALLRGSMPPKNSVVVEVQFEDNPWFPEVLQDELEYDRVRDPDKYAHVWRGGYLKRSESRVFHNWREEEFETPPNVIHRLGADWGFSVDPSVLIRSHIVGRTMYVDYEAYEIGCEIDNLPSLFRTVPEAERWPIIADNNRPDTISYMKKHGFPKIYGAVKGPGSIEDGVEFLKTYDLVIHPRCKHTIDELTFYSYKTDKDTGAVLPILLDKKNHVIDALRYSNEGERRTKQTKPPIITKLVPTNNPYAKKR